VLATFVKAAQAMQQDGSFGWMRDMIDIPAANMLKTSR
jgi:hypothetical protein